MWEYVKGSEADFEGAPEWATHLMFCSKEKPARDGDRAWTDGEKIGSRWQAVDDSDLYDVIAEPKQWHTIVERRKVGKYDHLNDLPLVSEKYPQTLQSRVNDANLTEALIAERGTRYGEFKDGAAIMQQLKHVMKSASKWETLKPSQKEALEMIQHKIGRILNGDPDYDDNWKDIAGYATLIVKELQ